MKIYAIFVFVGVACTYAVENDVKNSALSNYEQEIRKEIARTEKEIIDAKKQYYQAKANFETCRKRKKYSTIFCTSFGAALGAIVCARSAGLGGLIGFGIAQLRIAYYTRNATAQHVAISTTLKKIAEDTEYDYFLNRYKCAGGYSHRPCTCSWHNLSYAKTQHKMALEKLYARS